MPSHGLPSEAAIGVIIDRCIDLEGPLLPILHGLQDAFGYIPGEADSQIIAALNITRAELHGVISFYPDFHREPLGRHVVKICQAEACQAVGAIEMAEQVLSDLDLKWHETTEDGALTVEPVYCLGLCSCGPAALSNNKVVGGLDEARLKSIIKGTGT